MEGMEGEKVVWKCIRDIQWGRRGLVPVKCVSVRDEEGLNLCNTPQKQQKRWCRHFTKVMNIHSQFDEEGI